MKTDLIRIMVIINTALALSTILCLFNFQNFYAALIYEIRQINDLWDVFIKRSWDNIICSCLNFKNVNTWDFFLFAFVFHFKLGDALFALSESTFVCSDRLDSSGDFDTGFFIIGGFGLICGLGFSAIGGEKLWNVSREEVVKSFSSILNLRVVGGRLVAGSVVLFCFAWWKDDINGAVIICGSVFTLISLLNTCISELGIFLGIEAAFFSVPWLDLANVSAALTGLSGPLPSEGEGEFESSGKSKTKSGVCFAAVLVLTRGKLILFSVLCCNSKERTSDIISAKTLSILFKSSEELSLLVSSRVSGDDVCRLSSDADPTDNLTLCSKELCFVSVTIIDWLIKFGNDSRRSLGSVPPISVSNTGGLMEVTTFSSAESLDLERDRDDELLLLSPDRLFLSSGLQ